MSVSLLEVFEHGGYGILDNVEDAQWLLSKQTEFTELINRSKELVSNSQEVEDDDNEK